MLKWTITLVALAIVAAVFGFGGISAESAGIAKTLFFILLVLVIISLFSGKKKTL